MKIGTKSFLFGAHQFLLHPLFLALAWKRRYGFPWDPRLWAAFALHDLGYLGCTDMDGESGAKHPELGARIMGFVFGKEWGEFTLLHSRAYAKKMGKPVSKLCVADKLATAMMPSWLWITLACITGEVDEYMRQSSVRSVGTLTGDVRIWFRDMCEDSLKWAEAADREGALAKPTLA